MRTAPRHVFTLESGLVLQELVDFDLMLFHEASLAVLLPDWGKTLFLVWLVRIVI